MKIRGVIYNKRTYQDPDSQNIINILFVEVEDSINVNDEWIKFIPIIGDHKSNYCVGEEIEIYGKVECEYIMTSMGKPSHSPIPVILPCS